MSFQSREDDSAGPNFLKKSNISNDFQFKRPVTRNSFGGLFNKENMMVEETLRKKSSVTPSTMNVEDFGFDLQLSSKKRPPQIFTDHREPIVTDFSVSLDYDPESPSENVSTPKNYAQHRGR